MTPNLPNNEKHQNNPARIAAGLAALVGFWFFLSPWVYGAYMDPNAWNSWLVGGIVAILGFVAATTGTAPLAWLNVLLGAWAIASPWVYGYTGNTGRFVNSLCVGIVLVVLSISAATGKRSAATRT